MKSHEPEALVPGFCSVTAQTPIAAANNGHIEIIKLFLIEGADVNAHGKYDDTALIAASKQGHIEIVKLLLKKGADVHARGTLNTTALMEASSLGHIEIVKLLLKNGAYLNDVNKYGDTAMTKACFFNHTELINFLKTQGAEEIKVLTYDELENMMGPIAVFKYDCKNSNYSSMTFKTEKGTFKFW